MQELIFRSLFVNNDSSFVNNDSSFVNNSTGEISKKVKVYFIEFYTEFDSTYFHKGNPKYPSDNFLNRFQDFRILVKKESLNTVNYAEGVIDKVTGELGE